MMSFRLLLSIAASLMLLAGPAGAEDVKVIHGGPLYRALILPAGAVEGSLDSEERVVIRGFDPRRLAELSLLSDDGQHGRHIEKIEWSSDDKYLVFTTSSSGGHSPWNFRTYVFSTDHWQFLCLDDAVSPVTGSTFKFSDPSDIVIQMCKTPKSGIDETEAKTIDLPGLPWK